VEAVRLEVVRDEGAGSPSPGSAAQRVPVRVRVIDGALDCIARQGVAKTTLDDVARQAGCSRATVYRAFPGGKDGVLAAVVDTEVSRFFSALAVRMGQADDLEDVLVVGMTEGATRVVGHGALSYLLCHEPEVVLPHLAFARKDEVLTTASAFVSPFLGRWLDHDESARVAEWAARIVMSYLACPADGVDLTNATDVRALVRTFVLPGIRSLGERSPERAEEGAEPKNGRRKRTPLKRTSTTMSRTTTKGEAS
jgi:AcrR family transcriptional regulator